MSEDKKIEAKPCPFSLIPMKDKGYEGWHYLQYKDGGMAAPLCPEESEAMAKILSSTADKEQFHQNTCNSCKEPMSNDCPTCQRLWES